MDDNETPTQLQSTGIGASEKAKSVSSMCSEDMSLCSEDNNCYVHPQPIMDDKENPTQLQPSGIDALDKAKSISSMCSEDMSLCSEDNNCDIHAQPIMDDSENLRQLQSAGIDALDKAKSVSSMCSEDNNFYVPAQPIIDVTWRGGFDICNEDGNGKIHGLKAHLSNKACPKVWGVAVKIPKLISVEIVPRLNTWPKSFSESPPTDDNIAIYIFPEDESHEQGFNNLLRDIICGDLALKSVVDNSELLLFTSLQLPTQHQRFQGKMYLWGVFRGKLCPSSYLSHDQISVQSLSINLAATAVESNGPCADGTNDGVPIPTKEINIDVWEHGKPAGLEKPGVTCNYCNHVYFGRAGVGRFRRHLSGGCTKWHIKGCPKVPKEVREAMKETLEAKAIVKMKKLTENGVSCELQGGNQRFEMTTESVLGESIKSHFKEMGSHLCVSDSAVHLKEKTVPGSISFPPEQGPSGGTGRTQVTPQCNCCVTSETPLERRNRSILRGSVTTLKTYGCQEQSEVSKKEQRCGVVKKAKRGRPRRTEGMKARSCTSNLLRECGYAMEQIQHGDMTIEALPRFLIPKHSELPAKKVVEPQNSEYLCEEVTRRSFGSNPLEKGANSSNRIELEHDTVQAHPSLLSQLPETPVEKVTEPQTYAAENTPNSNPTPPITSTSTFFPPYSQQADDSVTALEAAQNVKEKASQSTDSSFFDFVKVMTEEGESTADSEHPSVAQVGPYTVKHHLGPTLKAIFDKYSDIAKGSIFQSSSERSHFLEGLCEVLYQLKDIELVGLRRHHLDTLLAALTTAESVGLDVAWLRQRYDDLETTMEGIKKYSGLKNDLSKAEAVAESIKKSLDSKKAEMIRLQSEMETLNGQMDLLRVEQEELESKVSNVRLKAKRFRHKNLADGLL